MINRAIVLALLALTLNLSAASHTWTGGGANELWNNAANWSGGAPTAGEAAPVTLVFPGGITTTNNIAGLTVDSIIFSGDGTVLHGSGGGTLTFRGAGGTNIYSSTFLYASNVIAATLPVTLSGSNYFSFAASYHDLAIFSAVSGSGSVTLAGDGQLYYGGAQANTATGRTLILNGALYLTKSAGVDAVAGPVEMRQGSSINTLRLRNANQIPNAVAVTVGPSCILYVDADESLGNLTMAGGTLDASTALLTLVGNVSATALGSRIEGRLSLGGATRTFNVLGGASLAITASITNGAVAAGLTKSGPGVLSLEGTNNFTGAVSVTGGTLSLNHNDALGATAGGLTVNAGGSLQLNSVNIGAEALTLNGPLAVTGTNSWAGAVTIDNETSMDIPSNAQLTLGGFVSGLGPVTKAGPGVLTFSGISANTFSGGLSVAAGTVSLNKSGVNALVCPLQIGPGTATVRWQQANQIADSVAVAMYSGGTLDLNNFSDAIGSLSGTGTVNLVFATLTTGGDNTSTTFSGSIGGVGFTPIVKNGSGTFTLSGTNNCSGTSVVNAGTLAVSGKLASGVFLAAGATLTGSGQVGNVGANAGNIRPGNAVGLLTTGNLHLTNGAGTLTFEINGSTAGVLYDQIVANGTVNLSNPTLALALNTFGALSNQYILIANDGNDPVTGTFNGLPEGTIITSGMVSFRLTYQGGTGNDVALVQTAAPPLPRITKITPQPGGAMVINATGLVNTVYFVDATLSLPATNWTVLNAVQANGSGALSYTDGTAPGFTNRFYRLRAQ